MNSLVNSITADELADTPGIIPAPIDVGGYWWIVPNSRRYSPGRWWLLVVVTEILADSLRTRGPIAPRRGRSPGPQLHLGVVSPMGTRPPHALTGGPVKPMHTDPRSARQFAENAENHAEAAAREIWEPNPDATPDDDSYRLEMALAVADLARSIQRIARDVKD